MDVDYEEFNLPREQKPFMLVLPDLDGIPGNGLARSAAVLCAVCCCSVSRTPCQQAAGIATAS